MAEAKVREKDFNLLTWFTTIPMTDDVFLGLQAQNLARVEMSVLREWERKVLDEQRSDPGNYQGPRYRELLALSQMWVFGVYELMRTWRERARELLKFEETLKTFSTQEAREAYLTKIVDEAKERARHIEIGGADYPEHIAKVGDAVFMQSIKDYQETTKDLWLELSAVRMPAAKHQLPGKDKLPAQMPGLGLPSPYTGSIHWKVLVGKDRQQREIGRRELADRFFGLYSWYEDAETALGLAKENTARRKRLQREARRLAIKSGKDGLADEFFRTAKEANYDDDHPALPTDPEPYFVKKSAAYERPKEAPK
jgi:hypothetical protein